MTMTILAQLGIVRALAPSRRRQPVDAPAAAQRLLRRRDHRADHPGRAMLRDAAAELGSPDSTIDTWPLRESDPVRVDGYRLVSRLGSGGTAGVFYALAPAGRPAAVKILRTADGAYLVTAYLPGYTWGSTLLGGSTPVSLWTLGSALAGAVPNTECPCRRGPLDDEAERQGGHVLYGDSADAPWTLFSSTQCPTTT